MKIQPVSYTHLVAARVHARHAGFQRAFFHHDAAPLLRGERGRGLRDERVGRIADGHDHGIHRQREFAARLGDGPPAAGRVRLAQFPFKIIGF